MPKLITLFIVTSTLALKLYFLYEEVLSTPSSSR